MNEENRAQEILALENEVKAKMTKDALGRYGNIKIANPDLAANLIVILSQIHSQIDDDLLKNVITKFNKKKEINIRYK